MVFDRIRIDCSVFYFCQFWCGVNAFIADCLFQIGVYFLVRAYLHSFFWSCLTIFPFEYLISLVLEFFFNLYMYLDWEIENGIYIIRNDINIKIRRKILNKQTFEAEWHKITKCTIWKTILHAQTHTARYFRIWKKRNMNKKKNEQDEKLMKSNNISFSMVMSSSKRNQRFRKQKYYTMV